MQNYTKCSLLIVRKIWYQRTILSYLLWPLSLLYRLGARIRRFLIKPYKFSVPVIVVGNITVGGTGKTPLVIYLADMLRLQGKKPGIVSRGYGGASERYPLVVDEDSDVNEVGDEALLLALKTLCPMVVAPDRVAAVKELLRIYDCDVVISDDGLQHYALGRDFEIAVVDGERKFGNGFCLPAGPLREPVKRLREVDFVATNGENMQLVPDDLYKIGAPANKKSLAELAGMTVHAIAGIGNPERFFKMLRAYKIVVIEHPFPDHYQYQPQDILFNDDHLVIMTEKDAVKCLPFATDDKYWGLPVAARLESFIINV